MRIAVIGATGHIGSYLVPLLVGDGHEVFALSRGTREPYHPDPAWQRVHRVTVDRDAEDRTGAFGRRLADLDAEAVVDLMCFTPESAQQLVDALRGRGTYLLHCGTVWVHGTAETVPVREDEARDAFGDYGTGKAAIERLLLEQARDGVPATVLHPGHISGPGWNLINPAGNLDLEVWRRLAAGEQLALPHFGLETLHHVHASDVAQGFMLALEKRDAAVGESFHLVSEAALTLRGYAAAVAGWFGREPQLRFLSWEAFREIAGDENAQATWEHIARSPSMSIDKARDRLGYQPRYTSLETALEAVRWLVQHEQLQLDRTAVRSLEAFDITSGTR
jgi:nucleoside-diphosphate-sugar epimerase